MSASGRILGVSVVGDLTRPSNGRESPLFSNERVLGLVLADDKCLTIKQLRSALHEQVDELPASFRFVTSQGWPVSARQEALIKAVHVVNESGLVRLQKTFVRPRIGVLSEDGSALGFLLIDTTESIKELRLGFAKQVKSFANWIGDDFFFLDQNCWPVAREQERDLTVADVLIGQTVKIRSARLAGDSHIGIDWIPGLSNPHVHKRESPVFDNKVSDDGGDKQILISYVRKEAAKFAQDLKSALCTLGFSVYLDVHEIKPGIDWQDSLNEGVSTCQVFVPLITPSYGETQWTNREVKLADVLGKYIVPVNFLSDWPPRCLAIQFATTQFIPWRLPGSDADKCVWDEESLKRVAKEIGEKALNRMTSEEKPASLKRSPSSVKPLLLICCHTDQKALVDHLEAELRHAGYAVWNTAALSRTEASHAHSHARAEKSVSFCVGVGKEFLAKVDEAACVIFVLSASFAKSIVCQQQIYYCEHRKKLVKLQAEKFAFPPWLSLLIGTKGMIDSLGMNYEKILCDVVKRALDPNFDSEAEDAENDAQLSKDVELLKKELAFEQMVYISGGVIFFNSKSSEICRFIGEHLAKNPEMYLVTGGFHGVGETIGKSFAAQRTKLGLPSGVIHVLPERDDQDFSAKAKQNDDGSFLILPYGKTLFCGTSVRQRERLISRVLRTCILVEGGPGAAHEAEEFAWNDHTVIPVQVTGGAAGGSFGVPSNIFQVPPGVSDDDWLVLSDENASCDRIGLAVASVVNSLMTIEDKTNGLRNWSDSAENARSPASTLSVRSTQDM
ncbi:uncharacterized protein [Oscarella lobularis]|uniref:uncharacterized protein n=1 Tax=Oscarella lobularis TaxID=121494 RepID=UPI0033137B3F